MEKHEKDWINKNLSLLVDTTVCHDSVLIKLKQSDLLSDDDYQLLQSKREIPKDQTYAFYDILMKRAHAYDKVKKILTEEKQSGAVAILNGISIPTKKRLSTSSSIDIEQYSVFQKMQPSVHLLTSENIIVTTYKKQLTISQRIPSDFEQEKPEESHTDNDEFYPRPHINENQELVSFSVPNISQRLIVTPNRNLKSLIRTLESMGESYVVSHDHISWEDLTEKCQQQCLRKTTVKFQGRTYTLKKISELYESCTDKSITEFLKTLEGTTLMEILDKASDKPTIISTGNLPGSPNKYISRTIISRRHISRNILQITKSDILFGDIMVFQGLGLKWYDLQALVNKYGNGNCDHSSNLLEKNEITSRNILLEEQEDFEKICKLVASHHPVHLFNCIKNEVSGDIKELEWVKSNGSLEAIHTFIHKLQTEMPENVLGQDDSTHPVLIANSAGTGKSTLLAHCANRLMDPKTTKTTAYVQYIVFGEFVSEFVHDMGFVDYAEFCEGAATDRDSFKWDNILDNVVIRNLVRNRIIKILSEASSPSAFGQMLAKSMLTTGQIRCELLFDGLDELLPNQFEVAKMILLYFKIYKPNVRIWVTMRPNMLSEFEENLGVLGYSMKPFVDTDPISILKDTWSNQIPEELCLSHLEKFAERCLQLVTQNMTEEEKLMVGIPLICTIIGEIYEDGAKNVCAAKGNDINSSILPHLNLSEIYTAYIDKKFQNKNIRLPDNYNRDNLHFAHMEFAIQLLFPKLGSTFANFFVDYEAQVDTRVAVPLFGLVENVHLNHTPRFLHRTFAEYFAAAAIIELFRRLEETSNKSKNRLEQNLIRPLLDLLRHVFSVQPDMVTLSVVPLQPCQQASFRFKFHNVCYFLSHLLQGPINSNLLHRIALMYSKITNDENLASQYLWKYLNAAVVANLYKLVIRLTECMGIIFDVSNKDTVDQTNFHHILFFAAKYGGKKMMHRMCDFFQTWTSKKVIDQELQCSHQTCYVGFKKKKTLLHTAVEAGNRKVVNYLLNTLGYREQLHTEGYSNLLHFCVENTNYADDMTVRSRAKIITSLAEPSTGSYFDVRNVYSLLMPLMLKNVHLDLIIQLLSEFVLNKKFTLPNFVYSDSRGQTIFHLLPTSHFNNMTPEKYHEALESLEIFFKFSVSEDKNDCNMRLPPIKLYLESFNCAGWTPVHVAVSYLDLLDKTLTFFEKYSIDMNLEDHRGSNCIFKAVAGNRSSDFLERLIQKGAKFDHRKHLGEHLLHVAAGYYNYDAVELFIKKFRESVNVEDEEGNTPLHVCFRKDNRGIYHEFNMNVEISPNNQHRIISFLIQNGADIAKENREGKTPLHMALKLCRGNDQGTLKQLKKARKYLFRRKNLTLALKGIILNSWIGSVWHPALITPFADELIRRKANVAQVDKNGATLLHLAADAHSIGVLYLLKNGLVDVRAKDNYGKTAMLYMKCYEKPEKCTIYNCRKIRECLLKAEGNDT